MVALELAAGALGRSQTMLGAVTVQVKPLRVNGETPLNANPVGSTSTTRSKLVVAVPPELLTTKTYVDAPPSTTLAVESVLVNC